MSVTTARRIDPLLGAGLLFLAANIAHTADHFRQGTGRLSNFVIAGGTLISVLTAVTLYLALTRHPRAAVVATITGLYAGFGASAAHLLPHWGVFSDSYPDLGVDAAAWAIALAEIAAGFVLGFVGLRQVRSLRRFASSN